MSLPWLIPFPGLAAAGSLRVASAGCVQGVGAGTVRIWIHKQEGPRERERERERDRQTDRQTDTVIVTLEPCEEGRDLLD